MANNEINTTKIWFGILLVFLLVGGYFLADQIMLKRGPLSNEHIGEQIQNIADSTSPYEQTQKMKRVSLLTEFKNTAKNNIATDKAHISLTSTGNISKGFLHIKASVNGQQLDQYSDIYASIGAVVDGQWRDIGGHLIGNRSLETPTREDATELLYNLSDIKYKRSYSDSNIEILSGNWLYVLNSTNNQQLITFSSTEGLGFIAEMNIFYECVEGTTCSITAAR